ncbi:MAG: hypothetical protein U0805_13430 [Pirellulales bacterium]
MANAPAKMVSGLVLFSAMHFCASCIVVPALVVLFAFGIADPVTAGWPTAGWFFIAGVVLTCIDSVRFSAGLYSARLTHTPNRRELAAYSMGSAIACLIAVPFAADLFDNTLVTNVLAFVPIVLLVFSFGLGWSTAKLTGQANVQDIRWDLQSLCWASLFVSIYCGLVAVVLLGIRVSAFYMAFGIALSLVGVFLAIESRMYLHRRSVLLASITLIAVVSISATIIASRPRAPLLHTYQGHQVAYADSILFDRTVLGRTLNAAGTILFVSTFFGGGWLLFSKNRRLGIATIYLLFIWLALWTLGQMYRPPVEVTPIGVSVWHRVSEVIV